MSKARALIVVHWLRVSIVVYLKVVLRGFVTAFITLMKAVECSRNIGSSCHETSGVFICDEFIERELPTIFIR